MKLHVLGALAGAILLVQTPGGAGQSRKATELGIIQAPEHPDSGKHLFLNGRQIKGHVRATWRDGVSYLNDLQWRPTRPVALPDTQTVAERKAMSRRLAQQLAKRVPFVKRQVAAGRSIEDAAAEFMRSRSEVIHRVRATFEQNKKFGYAVASQRAITEIDTSIAVADPIGPRAPRISEDGGLRIYFYGTGYYDVIVSNATPNPRRNPAELTIDDARSNFRMLAMYMESPGPVVVIYSGGGSMMCGGKDAETVIQEIAQVRAVHGSLSRVKRLKFKTLGMNEAREIAWQDHKKGH